MAMRGTRTRPGPGAGPGLSAGPGVPVNAGTMGPPEILTQNARLHLFFDRRFSTMPVTHHGPGAAGRRRQRHEADAAYLGELRPPFSSFSARTMLVQVQETCEFAIVNWHSLRVETRNHSTRICSTDWTTTGPKILGELKTKLKSEECMQPGRATRILPSDSRRRSTSCRTSRRTCAIASTGSAALRTHAAARRRAGLAR